jgi:predicted GTPase
MSETNRPTPALLQWKAKVQAKVNIGMPQNRAIIEVDRENPELRQAVLDEANQGRRARQEAGPVVVAAGTARAAWEKAITEQQARGLTRPDAMRAVERTHPGLRLQMLTEHNRAAGRRVAGK